MKTTELKPGAFYHDGKSGVRELIAIDGDMVSYLLLAAQHTQRWLDRNHAHQPLIGTVHSMTAAAFASWAAVSMDRATVEHTLLMLEARKIKLPPGQFAWMRSTLHEIDAPITTGFRISTDPSEIRPVKGLVQKGLVTLDPLTDDVAFTPLGVAWVQTVFAAPSTQTHAG